MSQKTCSLAFEEEEVQIDYYERFKQAVPLHLQKANSLYITTSCQNEKRAIHVKGKMTISF